jgi:hypothetical protein
MLTDAVCALFRGPLQDQNVMFAIAVYQTAASTGDLQWLATMRPALDAIAEYLRTPTS